MASVYSIDTVSVNEREDWRSEVVDGGLSARASQSFPGDPNLYIVKGLVRPPKLILTGFIEAATFSALDTALRTYQLMQESLSIYTVVFNGRTWSGLDLAEFELLGGPEPFQREGEALMFKQRVRFVWEKTTAL